MYLFPPMTSRKWEVTPEIKATWAERVKATMSREGLTGQGVADRLGGSRSAVSEWRNGRSLPSIPVLLAYSRLVREPVSWLIGDRLHGKGSMATLSQRLGLRLGGQRLSEIEKLSDEELLDALDLAIGRHAATRKRAARKKAR